MKRLAIPLVALGALLLGACSWRNDSAATVDGSDISSQDLEADTRALLRQPDFADVYLNTSVTEAAPTADVRLPTAALAVLLNRRISDAIVQKGLDERGITVSDADLQAAQSALEAQLAQQAQSRAQSQGGQPPDLNAAFAQLPEGLRNRLLRSEASATALRASLASDDLASFPADARAYYAAHPEVFAQYCVSSIPVESEDQGKALVRQTQGGTTLAELVTRQGGQDEGCIAGYQLDQLPAQLASDLRSAPPGAVMGPYEGQSGMLLVGLSSRSVPTFDQVSAQAGTVYEQARSSAEDPAWKAWLAQQKPDVTIDPRYGSWDAQQLTVDPPAAPRSA